METKKYGLLIRAPPAQKKKQPARPALPTPSVFNDEDDDDVEREISRQANKTKAMKDYEEQHKKALEEDPNAFDYDGVYDEMKQRAIHPRAQDREERKPKYIQNLMEKAKARQREQEIVYEKKLAKERSKEDHLYADKDKFVTGAYKKKLAEQAKWMEEERLRQLREEKDDVTKKTDISDFYFNLQKNVAFGARGNDSRSAERHAEPGKVEEQGEAEVSVRAQKEVESTKVEEDKELNNLRGPEKQVDSRKAEEHTESRKSDNHKVTNADISDRGLSSSLQAESSKEKEVEDGKPLSEKAASDTSAKECDSVEQPSTDQPKHNHHKRSEDAVAAAKERYLARKRARET